MKGKGQNTGARNRPSRPVPPKPGPDSLGRDAAARVLAAGGRVPKKFAQARPVSAGPTREQAESRARVSPARLAAFDVLKILGEGKGHSDDLLRGERLDALAEADRNLATALVMGVLRWQIALDAAIRRLLERPEQRLAEPVALALRLGAFQLLHMDRIPAHAALSESVELCRAAGQAHATGLVNAVLRRIATAPAPGTKLFEITAAFAERLGHPRWLVERWTAHYGREAALKICEADQAEPAPGGLFTPDAALPAIDDGSRLVAELAAAAMPDIPQRTPRVWDCCAAPGGKTLVMAARLSGAELLATDISPRRIKAMQGRLRRYLPGAGVRCSIADATKLPAAEGPFDLILCDVPCSGTGTLGRNPEIRLRLEASELARQAARQRELLAAALGRLAPGGRLVYSTCSLEPEENEQVLQAALAADSGVRRLGIGELLAGLPGLAASPASLIAGEALRTLPGVHPCDGFYAVVLERVDEHDS